MYALSLNYSDFLIAADPRPGPGLQPRLQTHQTQNLGSGGFGSRVSPPSSSSEVHPSPRFALETLSLWERSAQLDRSAKFSTYKLISHPRDP